MLDERSCKHIGHVAHIVCMAANESPTLSVADLPLVLALSRERTLSGAAEKLDLDLSTVFRRLNALERRVRVRLFDRSPRGYRLTAAGERAVRVERSSFDALFGSQRGRFHVGCGSSVP